eukprot:1101092-Pleurochrysis_carterae.AAC.3
MASSQSRAFNLIGLDAECITPNTSDRHKTHTCCLCASCTPCGLLLLKRVSLDMSACACAFRAVALQAGAAADRGQAARARGAGRRRE